MSPVHSHPSRNVAAVYTSRLQRAGMALGNRLLAQSDEQGALPTLAAVVRDLPGGCYLGPSGPREMRGAPTLVGRTPAASDPDLARRLWTASAELTGVDLPVPAA